MKSAMTRSATARIFRPVFSADRVAPGAVAAAGAGVCRVAGELSVVATGQAGTGPVARPAATTMDLDFIPAMWEEFDLILSGSVLPAAEPLIAALRVPAVGRHHDRHGGDCATGPA